jgi:hypothetical protein
MARRDRVRQIEETMLRTYAQSGARSRLDEIRREMDAIYRTFPDLRRPASQKASVSPARAATQPKKRARRFTAAQRKAIASRMKKYWAERRKAKS